MASIRLSPTGKFLPGEPYGILLCTSGEINKTRVANFTDKNGKDELFPIYFSTNLVIDVFFQSPKFRKM